MQLLSQVFAVRMALIWPILPWLSIYENFSLGVLWKAFHNAPEEVGEA